MLCIQTATENTNCYTFKVMVGNVEETSNSKLAF